MTLKENKKQNICVKCGGNGNGKYFYAKIGLCLHCYQVAYREKHYSQKPAIDRRNTVTEKTFSFPSAARNYAKYNYLRSIHSDVKKKAHWSAEIRELIDMTIRKGYTREALVEEAKKYQSELVDEIIEGEEE